SEIHYATHKATPVIIWRRMVELASALEDSDCQKWRWATFDVNNDGKEDLVVKSSSYLEEKLTDELWFFESNYEGLKSVGSLQEFFKVHRKSGIGYLKLGGYYLTDLPASHPVEWDKRITTEIVITPFRF